MRSINVYILGNNGNFSRCLSSVIKLVNKCAGQFRGWGGVSILNLIRLPMLNKKNITRLDLGRLGEHGEISHMLMPIIRCHINRDQAKLTSAAFKLGRLAYCAPAQKHKIGKTSTQ